MSEVKAFDIGALFQRIKHTDVLLTPQEKMWVKSKLLDGESHLDIDTHTYIYVFILSHDPTPENLGIVERFLLKDTEDYVRQAALSCLVKYWDRIENYDEIIIEALEDMDNEDHESIGIAACAVVFDIIHRTKNKRLFDAVVRKIKFYMQKKEQMNGNEEFNFIMLCENLYTRYSEYILGKRDFVTFSREDALKIGKNYQIYLPLLK